MPLIRHSLNTSRLQTETIYSGQRPRFVAEDLANRWKYSSKFYANGKPATNSYYFLAFKVWPLLPTHCTCSGLLLHLITLRHSTLGRTPLDDGSAWQHITLKEKDIHAPGRIRTHNVSKREAANPRPRPRDHWDQPRPLFLYSPFLESAAAIVDYSKPGMK